MTEKLKGFFHNEKVRNFNKKVFNKKTFKIAVAIIVLVVVLKVGFSLMFEVNGVVRKVNGSNITVANFFTTQTVNAGDYPLSGININVGDRIKITKNLSGQVLYIRDGSEKRGFNDRGMGSRNNMMNGQRRSKGIH